MIPLLVRVRCGARGGRCGQLLAEVWGLPRPPQECGLAAVMWNVSRKRRDRPVDGVVSRFRRIEIVVPGDYAGGTTGVGCADHGTWIEGNTLRRVRNSEPGWTVLRGRARAAGLRKILGADPGFEFELLRGPIVEARRTGKTVDFAWTPWQSPE